MNIELKLRGYESYIMNLGRFCEWVRDFSGRGIERAKTVREGESRFGEGREEMRSSLFNKVYIVLNTHTSFQLPKCFK